MKKRKRYRDVETSLTSYLNSLKFPTRVKKIDMLVRLLNFERRFATLTEDERQHMFDESLSPAARQRLDDAPTGVEREGLVTMYARAIYFRRCAWADYLNGVTNEKPFDSTRHKKAA